LNDHIVDPPTSGYVRILASDTALNPTEVTVNVTGASSINSPDYAGIDLRTVRGDIELEIGAGTVVNAAQTGVYVLSSDDTGGPTYAGGNIVITNRGQITVGPGGGVMGGNGLFGGANGGFVTINNYGTVTATLTVFDEKPANYGLLADGGNAADRTGVVSIYNAGTASAHNDAARSINYNGLALVENDVNGVLTSTGARGAVAWSAVADAQIRNRGAITATDGAGVNVWGATEAKLRNEGSIDAFANPLSEGRPSTFAGAHVWSQTAGDAVLTNTATGRIDARDGFGAWMQSTDGDVVIDNAGVIKGQYNAVMVTADGIKTVDKDSTLAVNEAAVGGEIKLTNTGLLTAYGLADDGIANRGLVTLAGKALTHVSLTNSTGGLIGAGMDLTLGFDTALLNGSATDLEGLDAPLKNAAVVIGARTELLDIVNEGTILGRIVADDSSVIFGTGPNLFDGGFMWNDGVWLTSGASKFGEVQNRGTLWAQGTSSLDGFLRNATGGTLVIAATSTEAANYSLSHGYRGYGGTIAFDIGAGAALGDNLLFDIAGAAQGTTSVTLRDMDGWDWQAGARDVIAVRDGSIEGAATFALAASDFGLVHYVLDYRDDGDEIWSLDGQVNAQATSELADIASGMNDTLATALSGAVDRMDELRDLYRPSEAVDPASYVASATVATDAMFAGFDETSEAPLLRSWVKAMGAYGEGDSLDARQTALQFGADLSTRFNDVLAAGGVFGTLTGNALDFESGNAATLDARAFGIYGLAQAEGGLFVSGAYAIESADADIEIYSELASFGALLHGGRVDAGYRTELGGFAIEPSVGLRLGHVDFDDFEMSNATVSTADATTYGAEARLRVSHSFVGDAVELTPYAVLTIGAGGTDGGDIVIDGAGLVDAVGDTGLYGGLAVGLQAKSPDGRFTGSARADSRFSDDLVWGALKLGGAVNF